jgi:hypothetical protein
MKTVGPFFCKQAILDAKIKSCASAAVGMRPQRIFAVRGKLGS